ncbi:MAG: amino acid ABC transporter permease [Actinomycetota bacterium]|nr:amino acid ABC transporter permease [Actinomycetota bacterium]
MTTETLAARESPFARMGGRAWAWARQNLFSSRWNSLLTVVVGALALWLGFSLVRWVVAAADWAVVQVNSTLFMVGRFPRGELWRVWASLVLVAALSGLSWGRLVGGLRLPSSGKQWRQAVLAALAVVGALLYATATSTRLLILATAAVVLAGRAVGGRMDGSLRRLLQFGWVLSYPAILVLLAGFGGAAPELWGGFLLTVLLTVNGIALAFPLGILLALGRASSFPAIRWLSVLYIELIRGVPLITVLFTAFLLFPLFVPTGVQVSIFVRAQVAIIAFSAAYVAENVRGGLQSIPTGQFEAARALGLSPLRTTGLVVLPQALRAVIPTLVGQFISLFKDTSLVVIVGLLDLLTVAQVVTSQSAFRGQSRETLIFAALLYWIVAFSMSRWSQRLERRLGVGER